MGAVACVGCSGMVPALVLLDQKGLPVRGTIQQNDARAVDQIARIARAVDQDDLYERTVGGPTSSTSCRGCCGSRRTSRTCGRGSTCDGLLRLHIISADGSRSVERNWAAESGVFDIRHKRWLPESLEMFGIDPALLPPVNDSGAVVGRTLPGWEQVMGLPAGTPVIAGAADHVASALAAGILQPGDLLVKFGGAGDILFCTDGIQTPPKLFFDYHILPGKSLPNGCMARAARF
jgi:xylulokinase